VQNNRITSIQQYDGSGWLEVGGMIWTGTRWVDPGSYDVVNYADLFDVLDDDEAVVQAVEQTNSILGSILEVLTAFRDGVFSRLDALGGGSGSDDDSDIDTTSNILLIPGTSSGEDDDGLSLWSLLKLGIRSGVQIVGLFWNSGIHDSVTDIDSAIDGVSNFGEVDITAPGEVDTSPPMSVSDTDEIEGIEVINLWGY
jgi:hypothetical protein